MRQGQLVFIDRTVWNGDVLDDAATPEERRNEPVVFDHEEVLEVAGKPYWRWWFIDVDGNIDFIQGCNPPKTAEELFSRKVEA